MDPFQVLLKLWTSVLVVFDIVSLIKRRRECESQSNLICLLWATLETRTDVLLSAKNKINQVRCGYQKTLVFFSNADLQV